MKHEIEIFTVPEPAYSVAQRRMAPFVRYIATVAQHGQLDLLKLACSAYLQGAYDIIERYERLKEENENKEDVAAIVWWP